MKKKGLIIGLSIVLVLAIGIGVTLVLLKINDEEYYDGNFNMTYEIAESILSELDLTNNIVAKIGNDEYGFVDNGDNFIAYEKGTNKEIYYGGKDDNFYRVTIEDNQKSYVNLASWEAKKVLLKTKDEIKLYFDLVNSDTFTTAIKESKEYGDKFGNLIVSGNGQKQNENETIPQTAYIVYTVNLIADNTAFLYEISYAINEYKLNYVSINVKEEVEGFIPDNIRTEYIEAIGQTVYFEYNQNISMPIDKGENVTADNTSHIVVNGSLMQINESQERGSLITLDTPYDDGLFLGWFYDKDYQLEVGEKCQVGYLDNTDIYAKWNVPQIQVELNGGELTKSYQDNLSKIIFVSDLKSITPSKTGHKFGGWYTDTELENSVFVLDDSYKVLNDTKVYAKWLPLVKVTLSAETSYSLPKLVGVNGDNMKLSQVTPVKRGKIFNSWFLDSEFNNPVVDDGFPAENTVFYAKYDDAICVDINFENASLTISLDKYINIPLIESEDYKFADFISQITQDYIGGYNDTGYFNGWYADKNLTQLLLEYPTSDITLYPKISPKSELYYYDINAGEGILEDIYDDADICINWLKAKFTPINEALHNLAEKYISAPEGKQFAGWYSDAELTIPYEPLTYPLNDTKIYASYQEL